MRGTVSCSGDSRPHTLRFKTPAHPSLKSTNAFSIVPEIRIPTVISVTGFSVPELDMVLSRNPFVMDTDV